MPTYKNRPYMEPTTVVRRHISMRALEQLLREKQLRMTRVDTFHDDDSYEGSVPQRQIDDQVPLFSSWNATQSMYTQVAAHYPDMELPRRVFRDPWELMTIRRLALTRSMHASCWTAGPESGGMWRLYCDDDGMPGQGVAIRSTLAKLEASVEAHGLYVSPIIYRHYHEGPAFDDHLDAVMHKRAAFQDEREVRLLRYDEPHYVALSYALTGDHTYGPPPSAPSELPTHIPLAWNVLEVAEAITISPYAGPEYEARARAAIAAIDPAAAALVEPSALGERGRKAMF
jgi:hypothetical protein